MLKTALVLIFIFYSAVVPLCAETLQDITINADSITYSQDGLSLEASGSVEALSGTFNVKANHLVYHLENKRILADNGFSMKLASGFAISGEALDYSLASKEGSTENMRVTYKSTVITGDKARMNEERIELEGSSFNSCGLENPHYQITSATTTLYPEEGWVLGYYGLLWINQIPVLPIPVYIYDISVYNLGTGSRRSGDVLAFPEIGSNDEDGSYIIQRVPWIANKRLTGRAIIGATENGGPIYGIDGKWSSNDYNDFNFRLAWDKRYWYYGGLTHTLRFGDPLVSRRQDLYTFLRIKQDLMMEAVTNLSVNERINYQRVSMLPEVALRINPVPAFYPNLTVRGEIAYGHIREASTEVVGIVGYEDDRGRLDLGALFTYPLVIGRFDADLSYNHLSYGKTDPWKRISYNLKLSQDFGGGIDTYVSNLHYLLYDGNSPFQFERYFELPSDEFGIGLGYNFDHNRLSVDYAYYLPYADPKDLDYGLSLGFHCYSIDMKYRATRKEFTVGVTLITG